MNTFKKPSLNPSMADSAKQPLAPNKNGSGGSVSLPASPSDAKATTAPLPATQVAASAPTDKDASRATKGDNGVMSQSPQPSSESSELKSNKWKKQLNAAKLNWDKLSENELIKLNGEEAQLAGLVQERYAVTRLEADRQVKKFFDNYIG